MNSTVCSPATSRRRARSMTPRTSFTPGQCRQCLEPSTGRPGDERGHRRLAGARRAVESTDAAPDPSTRRCGGEPGFNRCVCPTTSDRRCGRIRTARARGPASKPRRADESSAPSAGSASNRLSMTCAKTASCAARRRRTRCRTRQARPAGGTVGACPRRPRPCRPSVRMPPRVARRDRPVVRQQHVLDRVGRAIVGDADERHRGQPHPHQPCRGDQVVDGVLVAHRRPHGLRFGPPGSTSAVSMSSRTLAHRASGAREWSRGQCDV